MLDEDDVASSPEKLWDVVSWAGEFEKIGRLIFHISSQSAKIPMPCLPPESLKDKTGVTIISEAGEKTIGSGAQKILIVVGKGGTEEICDAIVKIAKEGIEPEKIDESVIESHLSYQVNPDFIIKTGKSHLTDFLIWQSVYSELLFTDINWDNFRRVDFLRALRDFEARTRRYGK
ncbi:MAG TPA: undecaprenyl diphosphate synthase family protein [Methanocorpusculum sp.]|nr:undecaprenyl diphosphate synthase family protein [Methanocorpusculum sp.]